MKNICKRVLAAVIALLLVVRLLPVMEVQAASAPKLSTTAKTMYLGDKVTLKVKNQPKSSTVTWSSGNKKVATVTSKGVVKAVKKGSTNITCKVKQKATKTTKAKTYTLKCKVTVKSTGQTVTTQKALKKALKNTKLTKITISTTKEKKFTIPKGSYKKVALVVNAPNADVVNKGEFKSIDIKAVKADTFTEKAKGNKITVSAENARLVVDKVAEAASITVTGDDTAVVINGTAKKMTVSVPAEVHLEVNGSLGKLVISAVADLTIKGSAGNIPVTVKKSAKGTRLVSSVKLNLTADADVSIELSEGAEGSSIVIKDSTIKVKVINNTAGDIAVTTPDGTVVETIPSKTEGGTPGGDTPSGGGSSGGGDTPSGGGSSGGGDTPSGGGSSSGTDDGKIEITSISIVVNGSAIVTTGGAIGVTTGGAIGVTTGGAITTGVSIGSVLSYKVAPEGATGTVTWTIGGKSVTADSYTVADTDAGQTITVTIVGTGKYKGTKSSSCKVEDKK